MSFEDTCLSCHGEGCTRCKGRGFIIRYYDDGSFSHPETLRVLEKIEETRKPRSMKSAIKRAIDQLLKKGSPLRKATKT